MKEKLKFNRNCCKVTATQKIPEDNMIWHYTSADVFVEFMKDDSCLYATHHQFLNDADEVNYGFQLCMKILRQDQHLHCYSDDVEKELGTSDVFLCCFSKQADSLYQWRSYTPAGGFSIGFSKKEFEKVLKDSWLNEYSQQWQVFGFYPDGKENAVAITLTEAEQKFIKSNFDDDRIFNNFYTSGLTICEYEFAKQKQEFEEFLRREYERESQSAGIYNDVPVCSVHNPGESKKDYHHKHMIVNSIKDNSIKFKNPSFAFEEEVRIVYQSDGFLNKRLVYIGGKPRIPTHIRDVRNLIRGVYVSPHGNRARNRKLAEMFRDKYDLNFEIKESNSSFIGD